MRGEDGDISKDSMSGFFKQNMIFLQENSIKSLKRAQ